MRTIEMRLRRTVFYARSSPSVCVVIAMLMSSQVAAFAQQPAVTTAKRKFELSIDKIMEGFALVGYEPRTVRWSGDSQRIYFQWKQASEPREKDFDTYVVNRDGTSLRKLSDEEAKAAPPLAGDRSRDRRLTAFVEDGDIFLFENDTGKRRQLTATTDVESNPRFTRDQKRIYFTRANNLYALALDGASFVQLTDIRVGGGPPTPAPPVVGGLGSRQGGGQARRESTQEQKGTESQEYLKQQERELIDSVKRRADKRREDDEKRKREHPRQPFNIAARQVITNLQLTPDDKYVIATVSENVDGAKNAIVPNYVTESAYTEDLGARNKVGDVQSRTRLAIINVATGDAKWVDHGQKASGTGQGKTDKPITEQ